MPEQKPGALSKAWDWANAPVVDTGEPLPPGLPGMADLSMRVGQPAIEALSTPVSLATLAFSGGAGAAGSLGRQALARALQVPGALLDLAYLAAGLKRSGQGVQAGDWREAAKGAGQAGLAGFGVGTGIGTWARPPGPLGRPTRSADLFDDSTLDAIVTGTAANGGTSTRARVGDLGGQPGKVAVGMFPETAVKLPPGRALTRGDLRASVDHPTNNVLLQAPRAHLGTWHVSPAEATTQHPAGMTVIDVGLHPPTVKQAIGLGEIGDQQAVFELGNFTTHPVPKFVGRDWNTRPQAESIPMPMQRRVALGMPMGERALYAAAGGGAEAGGALARRTLQRDQRVDPEALRAELLAQMRASVGRQ